MKRKSLCVLLLLLVGCETAKWRRGNLHTHSLWSDGDDFPEMIVAWYRDNGYDFLALSDHNILSRGEKWMKLKTAERRAGKKGLAKYRERFGDDWVDIRGEGDAQEIRLKTLEEFRPKFEAPGEFLLIEGEEITDHFEGHPVHMNASNLAEYIPPQGKGAKSVREVMKKNMDAVEAQAKEKARRILAHLNHPNFHYAITAEDLAAVTNERYFEVFNGHPMVGQLGDASHPSVERLWDIANTLRLTVEECAPLYGIATDDSHNYHADKGSLSGRGWVMVRSKELEAEPILAAMEAGDFYASSGVRLNDVSFDGKTVRVTIDAEDGVEYTTQFIGTLEDFDASSEPRATTEGFASRRYSNDVGAVLAEVKGRTASYALTGKELYVRAMVRSNKTVERPVWEDQKEQAWTQPVGWRTRVE
ncbi:MAG: hypothetical protein AAF517_14810 [Planctomycetota bacterium]